MLFLPICCRRSKSENSRMALVIMFHGDLFVSLMGGKEMKGSELRLPYAAYHFSTSGTAVAVATAVTHPLGTQFPFFFCFFFWVVLTEGFGALYKGGSATFARLGPQTTITFIVCEKLRELAGMKAI
ncbi:hypothetical protein BHE74_00012666 [Ensete ventricosum]|nr:hypothetical protein GW17_00027906 [Ensete ventricosum]RWW79088.1 hypothetical protein BHE74_00012666 [Ensete ventricosum]RZR78331.1 hypothetical protein BHM03_00003615 [Ensete ventricosum]